MTKYLIQFIAAGALMAVPNHADATTRDWRPCKYEDSVNCVWDARHMGNGEGRSFIARRNGDVKFISHRRAHRMLAK